MIKDLALKILSGLDCSALPEPISAVTILLTSDNEIRELNKNFRGKDKPTDVLSFSSIEGLKNLSFETQLGDLVISLDTAKKQAKRYEVTLYQELARLITHGLLHLFGYDHEGVSKSAAQRMRRLEQKIFIMLSGSLPGSANR